MKRRTNHEGQPRLQTSQRIGSVDTAGQRRTHPKARESKQGTARAPKKARTAGGDDRTTNKAREASRAKKALLHCRPKSSHNPYGRSLTQGAEPSEPLQARRCRRSTDNRREGMRSSRSGRRCQKMQKPPRATCGRVSSATAGPGGRARHKGETKRRTKNTANPTNIAPPQEQDRQLEPERLRNPLRVTCGRKRRGKPQAPQEEAQKQHQEEAQQ